MRIEMCPIAGGNWNNSSNAGVWAVNLNNARGNTNNNVGFRADSVLPNVPQGNGGAKGCAFRRAAQRVAAKSEGRPVSSRRRVVLDRHRPGVSR